MIFRTLFRAYPTQELFREAMVYCSHCGDHCPAIVDPDKGYICCGMCGKIIDQEIYSTEPTFIKDNSGQSRLGGTILRSIESGYSASHERTLAKGRDEIRYIVNCLDVAGGDSIIDEAHKFYQMDDATFEKEEAGKEERTFNEFVEFEENAENGVNESDFVDEFVFDLWMSPLQHTDILLVMSNM